MLPTPPSPCSEGADSNEGESVRQGSPVPNTLATTLALFPLAESRETGKRHRAPEEAASSVWTSHSVQAMGLSDMPVITNDSKLTEALQDVLFPAEDDVLGDTLDRLRVTSDTSIKRRKTPLGSAVAVMNRRVMALLEQSVLIKQPGVAPPALSRLPTSLVKAKPRKTVAVPPAAATLVRDDAAVVRLQQSLTTLATPKPVVYMMPNEFGVRMVSPYQLFDYQVDSVKWLLAREEGQVRNPHYDPHINGCLLAMVMGLGKTPTAATLVARSLWQQRSAGSCSLYVCPKVLLGTVRHEFEKFFGDQLRLIIYHQNFLRSDYQHFGLQQLRQYDVVITNYSTITSRMQAYNKLAPRSAGPGSATEAALREFCEFEWFRIVLDESHEIRERRTARFRTLMQLKAPRRLCLTGTPIHNKIADLYSQMEFCGLRLPRGTKLTKANLQQLQITNMIRFVEYKDAASVTLPPKHSHKVYFDLSEDEKTLHRFYTDNARMVWTQSQTETGRNKGKRTLEALAGMVRVLQVCSAPYLVTPASKEAHNTDDMCELAPACVFPADARLNQWLQQRDGPAGLQSSKMQAFVKLMGRLRQGADQAKVPLKLVVFANLTSTLRLAQGALTRQWSEYQHRTVLVTGDLTTPKREELFTRFRIDALVETLFMTLKLGSIGLNLTEADTVVFLEPWYSYASLSQGESRVHRIGQVREVNVYYLLAKDSAEERVYRVAQNKKTVSEELKTGTADAQKLQNSEMQFILMDES